jgi:TRAP-type C4-dicarboxylate transport system permease small subunit
MSGLLKRAIRISNWSAKTISYGAEVVVFILVILVSYSAVSRYVFSKAVYFAEEIGGLLLMAAGFLAFPYVFTVGGHVRVTLLLDKVPKGVRRWYEVAVGVMSLIFLGIFIKLSWDFVYTSYQWDCHTVDAHLYEVPWMALLPVGAVGLAIAVLLSCINEAHGIIAKTEEKENETIYIG